jgi:hypothetical protein
MINGSAKIGLVFAALVYSHTTHAEVSILAGTFDGKEPKSVAVWESYYEASLATQQIDFTVSESGGYFLGDVYEDWDFGTAGRPGLGVITALYQGAFNPQQPALNRLGLSEWSPLPRNLQAGVKYILVLQRSSDFRAKGVWTLAFNGPGGVHSEKSISAPSLVQGAITGAERKMIDGCGSGPTSYQVKGPFRVSKSGTYYFTDLSHLLSQTQQLGQSSICFSLYTGFPDIENLGAHRIGNNSFHREAVTLQANGDYYLLVHSPTSQARSYSILVAPSAPVEISSSMSGLWADPATDGQGLLLDVYPSIDALHMAWFTYDLERPSSQASAQIGDPSHRWLTAFGALEGASSNMTITRTEGGVFDAVQPVPAQIQDGKVQLHFDSCASGTLTYNLGSANATGQLTLRRPFEDRANIARCEEANRGPGIPGPL